MTILVIISIFIFFFGATLTSFVHLAANRLPHHQTINGRSKCPSCNHQLRWVDIIPIFGYFLNQGKCHFCKSRIPWIHPLMEFIGGALFVISFLVFGLSLELIVSFVMILVLIAESISDLNEQIVIDRIWMIGIIPVIIIRIIQNTFLDHLLSAAVVFGFLYLIAWIVSKLYKKEALGGGDLKLYVFIGFVLSLPLNLLSLFLASICALIYSLFRKNKKEIYIPLVPFIAFGVVISYFIGEPLISLYLTLLGV